jgi:preprotein translocase subunit Sec61beta
MKQNKLTPEGALTIGALIAALIILSVIIAS